MSPAIEPATGHGQASQRVRLADVCFGLDRCPGAASPSSAGGFLRKGMALLFSCISGADVRETAWKVGSGALKVSEEACAIASIFRPRSSLRRNEVVEAPPKTTRFLI